MKLLNIPSLSSIAKDVSSSSSSVSNISLKICGACLAIGLVIIIYKLAHGSNGAKEALIGWFAAVIVYLIAVGSVI